MSHFDFISGDVILATIDSKVTVGGTIMVTGAPDDCHTFYVPLPGEAELLRGTLSADVALQLAFERVEGDTWRRTR